MTEPPALDVAQASPQLAAVLAQMGAVVLSRETIDTTITLVTALAVQTIPGTSGAGVTLVDARGARTTAASDALVEQADALQYQFDAGPCLTAWRDQVSTRIDDTQSETRWPEWTAAVASLGIRSVLSAPLLTQDAGTAQGTGIGAIKVYSAQAQAYDGRAEELLELFAWQAAILLANTQTLSDAHRLSADLRKALASRDIIGQAKGVLIAQGAADEQTAFQMLAAASQCSNTKLHDVARQVVASVHADRPAQPSA